MCGFIGYASSTSEPSAWLNCAIDSLSHRGPNARGVWLHPDGAVGLAHRRLSILDLSTFANQPLSYNDCGVTVAFNGEIYNFAQLRRELVSLGYRFKSNSDTEVLLLSYVQWGTDCLARLNGMFSFAIYDEKRSSFFLARDPAGQKPLFYYHNNSEFRFASELKALIKDNSLPRIIDPHSLDCLLGMGYVPSERCILHGFNKLPPAHGMTFDRKSELLW